MDPNGAQKMDATAAEAQQTRALKAKLSESYRKLADSSLQAQVSSKARIQDGVEKVKVFYAYVKDGALHIVGQVGDKIVVLKAEVNKIADTSVEKLCEARSFLQGKTVWLHDGYIHITTAIDGKLVHVKARASEIANAGHSKALHAAQAVLDFTEPARSKAVAVCEASNARVQQALAPLQPYAVKVHNGVANIITRVEDRIVVVQVKIVDTSSNVQVWTVESLAGARAVVQGYTSPVVSRFSDGCVNFRNGIDGRIECFSVSIKGGVVSLRDSTGRLLLHLQNALADAGNAIQTKASDAKTAIRDLTEKLVLIVSRAYGRTCDNVKLLGGNCKNGFLHIFAKVDNAIVVLRIRISDVVDYLHSKSLEVSGAALEALANTYGAGKRRVLHVVDSVRTKSSEIGNSGRMIASNPTVRVTAASAGAGAVAMGASGGAAGMVAGGALGLVCAVPAAFFTFGLSLPVGAAVGAGTGLCVGTATGGSAGLVTGGVAGYGAHQNKDKIGNGINGAVSRAKAYKEMAKNSTNKLRAQVLASTGGTYA